RLIKDFGSYLDESHIVTAYDVKRGKPAPEPYLMGLKKVGGINPWEAFIVENAPLGIKAGVTAQVFTIAVNTGPLPDEALLNEGANLLFPRMTVLSQHWKDLFTQCR
ncbi:MAG: HAD hydrolase-like protein, partial [Prevotella sp.]|nr:HAD hydrolase-like protein [Prevotella sp.]